MILGVFCESPIIIDLLKPHLPFSIQPYDTKEELMTAWNNGEIQSILWEKEREVSIQSKGRHLTLSKPFHMRELLVFFEDSQKIYTLGSYVFDPQKRLLKPLDTKRPSIPLREKETQLLCLLLASRDQGVSRQKLLTEIWRVQPGMETRTLETHIYHLRQKLEDDPHHPQILQNTADGYVLSIPPES